MTNSSERVQVADRLSRGGPDGSELGRSDTPYRVVRSALVRAGGTLLRYGMALVLVGLMLFASSLYDGFFTIANLNNVLYQVVPVGIVAIGMTFVIIGGGFDLSVAAIYASSTVAFAGLSNGMPLWTAFVCTTVLGMAAGLFNGLVITLLKVNAFIATLGSSSLFLGGAYIYSNAAPIVAESDGYMDLGTGKWGGVWIAIYVLGGFFVVGAVLLSRTAYGRSVYAVGGNLEAARLAGMRVNALRTSTFMLTGVCASVAGMITSSLTGVGQANVGSNIALDSIAIVIIGGTSLMGGEGAMWRTLVGVLIWGTVNNIFSTLALDTSTQLLMNGVILLVAVCMDVVSRRSRA